MSKKVYNKTYIDLYVDKEEVEKGEEITVTLICDNTEGLKPGDKIPYRIVPENVYYDFGKATISFTYNVEDEHVYLTVGVPDYDDTDIVTVTQVKGSPVTLIKVDELNYKFKEDFGSEEVDRTFRAIVKSRITGKTTLIGTKPRDFVVSNEYGYFELDENLRCEKKFRNSITSRSKYNRIFKLSLYYMPQYTVTSVFKEKYEAPVLHTYKPKRKMKIKITGNRTNNIARFSIDYSNLRKNSIVTYNYVDSVFETVYRGTFLSDSEGTEVIEIPITHVDLLESNRFIQLWIKEYPNIKATIFIG